MSGGFKQGPVFDEEAASSEPTLNGKKGENGRGGRTVIFVKKKTGGEKSKTKPLLLSKKTLRPLRR